MDTHARLLHDLHTAYENHAPGEARRLLHRHGQKIDCSSILRCGDEEYIRWLLSHDILPHTAEIENAWPDLQEIQLQCSALKEPHRPACIMQGTWETEQTGSQDE